MTQKAKNTRNRVKNNGSKTSRTVTKYRFVFPVLFVGTAIAFVMTGLYALEQRNQLLTAREYESILFNNSFSIPGRSCAILPTDVAEELLEVSVKRRSTNYSEPVIINDVPNRQHVDSCRYEAQDNSNMYLELFIITYDTPYTAEQNFESTLPVVSDFVDLDPTPFDGQKLIYDAGVHYLLRGREVIKVAASNGNAANTQEFSSIIFEQLIQNIE